MRKDCAKKSLSNEYAFPISNWSLVQLSTHDVSRAAKSQKEVTIRVLSDKSWFMRGSRSFGSNSCEPLSSIIHVQSELATLGHKSSAVFAGWYII